MSCSAVRGVSHADDQHIRPFGDRRLRRVNRRRVDHRTHAPRASAAAMKSMPVEPIAPDRHEELPRPNRPRVNRDAPISRAGSPCSSRPPVATAMSPAVSGSRSTRLRHPRAGAPARQRRACHLHVVERQRPLADDLVLFVTLPRDQHQIPGGRVANRTLDGALAVGDREIGRGPAERETPSEAARSAGTTMPRFTSSMI